MNTKQSLKDRLLAYMQRHHTEWIASGHLERLVKEHTTYSAANATRRLRELENEGHLEVKIVKGHAHYKFKDRAQIEKQNREALAYFDAYDPHR